MNPLLKRLLMQARLMEAAGEGGDPGAGAPTGDKSKADETPPADKKVEPTATDKKVSDEEARLLKENMKKKGQIDQLAKDLSDAKTLIQQLEELGGLDSFKTIVQKQKEDETKALEAKGEWERLKERMAGEHKSSVKSLEDQIKALQDQIGQKEGVIEELSVGSQFSQSPYITGELTLTPSKARVVYGPYFDVQEGKVVGYDKPRGSANRTAIVDASGEAMSFEEALKKIVEADPDRDHLIKAKAKQGAGSASSVPASTVRQHVQQRQEANKTGVSRIAAGLGRLGKIS